MSPSGEATQADCSEGQAVAHNEERRALCGGDDGSTATRCSNNKTTRAWEFVAGAVTARDSVLRFVQGYQCESRGKKMRDRTTTGEGREGVWVCVCDFVSVG